MEVVAQRVFEPFYMWLDIAFLVLFIGLLLFKKKYTTIIVGVLAGVLYQIVDFGIFHLATGSRHLLMNGVEGTESQLFWVLMWMSMSYGFTNFAWIWLWISRDKNLFEWTYYTLFLMEKQVCAEEKRTMYRASGSQREGHRHMLCRKSGGRQRGSTRRKEGEA